LVACIAGLLFLITFSLGLRSARGPSQSRPDQPGEPNEALSRQIDISSALALVAAIAAAYLLPPFQVVNPARSLLVACGCILLIGALALVRPLYESVLGLRCSMYLQISLKALAAVSALLAILSLHENLAPMRNWILMNMVFCGGLTLYREARRRRRAGDRSWSSRVGGWLVVIQFLSLIGVVAVPLTLSVLIVLVLTGLLRWLDPQAWLELVVSLLSAISVVYMLVYGVRRLMKARGFSWIDPPNWRAALPHIKYAYLPFGRGRALADIIRETYIKAIVGNGRDVTSAEIVPAAKIELPAVPARKQLLFAIIGDPGEGDDSQLYPINTGRCKAKSVAGQVIKSGMSHGGTATAGADQRSLDFVLISSDVVYPAGELMDYERAVYRPYQLSKEAGETGDPVPIYAIPGNHDWYDSLRGFFVNFTYAAAHSGDQRWQSNLHDLPWDWRPWRRRVWNEVGALRKDYRLETLGGLSKDPRTQQRLPFFQIAISGVPLTVLGLDTGASGSIDRLQYDWLVDRLAWARSADHLILVLLSAPLYVNGEFAGPKAAPALEQASPEPQCWSCGPREIYEQLRKYRVDVVIAGDTHAYQRYQVSFKDQQGQHTMHHIVNGGGGAYLTSPMDVGWVDFDWRQKSGLKLSRRVVYQAQTRMNGDLVTQADEVTLHDIFPSANEMLDKFVWSADTAAKRKLARFQTTYNAFVLNRGFTNALDHDTDPLLQSYLIVEMERVSQGSWVLRIVPWFRMLDASEPAPREPVAQHDRQLEIEFNQTHGDGQAQPAILDEVERGAGKPTLKPLANPVSTK
jgi:hypothetical protein